MKFCAHFKQIETELNSVNFKRKLKPKQKINLKHFKSYHKIVLLCNALKARLKCLALCLKGQVSESLSARFKQKSRSSRASKRALNDQNWVIRRRFGSFWTQFERLTPIRSNRLAMTSNC